MSDLQTCHDYLFIAIYSNFHSNKPRGKESTELRKSQIKGKESENSYQELKRLRKGQAHTNTRKLNRDISTGTAVFLNRKRVNDCVCLCVPVPFVISSIPGKSFYFPFP